MTQTEPLAGGAAGPRLLGASSGRGVRRRRDWRLPRIAVGADLSVLALDWRLTAGMLRRLLTGDLRVLRDAAEREDATPPLMMVMMLASFAGALGAWLWVLVDTPQADVGSALLRVLILGGLLATGGWAVWTGATWWALQRVFGVRADVWRLARPLALTAGFGVWQVLLLAGPISFAVGLVATVIWLLLSVVAVRAGTGVDDREAVISVGIGFAVYALLMTLTASLTGVAPGIWVHASTWGG